MKKLSGLALIWQELFSGSCLESEDGRAVTRKLKRSKMHEFFSRIEPCVIGMEPALGALLGA